MQVRPGQVLDLKGKLMQIQKFQHTQGSGRQLGNVQASLDWLHDIAHACLRSCTTI